ncbi:MAG TPA: DUF192 domain-containing protein [Candidatus Saccharimonadales bacterium]|jgi:uncharacterized membrane protein (UPF0127 family)|nr:DUF192 domain-containing protein [Candidatus Saccharimonadales bacterium]
MSNKTQKAKDVKIKSEPNKKQPFASKLAILSLLLIALGLLIGYLKTQDPTLAVNNFDYKLLVAKSITAQEKGLGNRNSLPNNEGMLFVFKAPAEECFWMKEMRFPLDIIWLSSTKKVVYVKTDLQPSTYPESFCASDLSQYVIELNAGQVSTSGIKVGQTLVF